MLVSLRSGALTAWGSAYLLGTVGLDDVADHVIGDDAAHRVIGVPGEDEAVTIGVALGRLRSSGAESLRLVLPEPGDLAGLPGPTDVNARAVATGCAVLTVAPPGKPSYALLPESARSGSSVVVRWDVVEVDPSIAPHGLPSLSEADRALSEAIAATTREIDALDVARGRDDIGVRLRALDRALAEVELPSTLPARAQRLIATASRLLGVLDLAMETDGASVTASEASQRLVALRPLRTAARQALCSAYSAASEASARDPRGEH